MHNRSISVQPTWFAMSTTDNSEQLSLVALPGLPLVQSGDNIGSLIIEGIVANNVPVQDDLIIVIAQKIVSKAEGRAVRLDSVTPGNEALLLAEKTGKDARLVELILSESKEIIRQSENLIITENNLGIIMANAGIDQSNIDDGYALLLPENPDDSAATIGRQVGAAMGCDALESGRSRTVPDVPAQGSVGIAIGVYGITRSTRRQRIDRPERPRAGSYRDRPSPTASQPPRLC